MSGTIACDQPIITQHADPHVPCVMLDTEVLEHRAKWGKSNGWRTEVTRKSQTFRDCPFYVIGSSEGAFPSCINNFVTIFISCNSSFIRKILITFGLMSLSSK